MSASRGGGPQAWQQQEQRLSAQCGRRTATPWRMGAGCAHHHGATGLARCSAGPCAPSPAPQGPDLSTAWCWTGASAQGQPNSMP